MADTVLETETVAWQCLSQCQTQWRIRKTTVFFSLSSYSYWIHSFRILFPISITITGILLDMLLCICGLQLECLESFCEVWLDRHFLFPALSVLTVLSYHNNNYHTKIASCLRLLLFMFTAIYYHVVLI